MYAWKLGRFATMRLLSGRPTHRRTFFTLFSSFQMPTTEKHSSVITGFSPRLGPGPGLKPHWDSPDDLLHFTNDPTCWLLMQWFFSEARRRTTTCGCLPKGRRLGSSGHLLQQWKKKIYICVRSSALYGLGKPNPVGCTSGNLTHTVTSQHFCSSCWEPTGCAHVFLHGIALKGRHLFSVRLECGRLQSAGRRPAWCH